MPRVCARLPLLLVTASCIMVVNGPASVVATAAAGPNPGAARVVAPAACIVWGSGVTAAANTPARYVFVQLVGNDGAHLQQSHGAKVKIAVVVDTGTGQRMLKVKVMDRGDGTFMGQYFFNSPAKAFTVKIKVGKHHAAASPYTLQGPLPAEKCRCPRPYRQFTGDYSCKGSDPAGQIDADLRAFPNGVTRASFDRAVARLVQNESSLVHFVFKDNKIYSENHGRYGGFQKFVDEILLSLARKVRLPDMELLLNMGDWPQSPRYDDTTQAALEPLPLFSWCGSDTHYDMVLPTYKLVQVSDHC